MKKTFIVSIIVSLIIATSFVAYMELTRKGPEDCHCDFDAMEKFAQEKGYSSIAEYEEAELESIMKRY